MSEEKQPKIHSCMIAIMREITSIGKDSHNQAQGFKFRGIDAIYNELHGLLAKHGVVTLPESGIHTAEERTTKSGSVLRFVTLHMTYRFIAADGSEVSASVVGEGMDSGDKATNKAMAIAHKYALLQTFLIPTEDMKDPDGESHEVTERPTQRPFPTKAAPQEHTPEPPPPRPVDIGETVWENVYVTDVKNIEGVSKGRPWTLYKVELEGGRTVSTFDQKIADAAVPYIDRACSIIVRPGRKDGTWEFLGIADPVEQQTALQKHEESTSETDLPF